MLFQDIHKKVIQSNAQKAEDPKKLFFLARNNLGC